MQECKKTNTVNLVLVDAGELSQTPVVPKTLNQEQQGAPVSQNKTSVPVYSDQMSPSVVDL